MITDLDARPTIDALIVVATPTLTPSSSTEDSTRAPSPTVTPSPSTLRSPTRARRATEHPDATSTGATTRPSTVAPSTSVSPEPLSRRPTSVLTLPSRMSYVPFKYRWGVPMSSQ